MKEDIIAANLSSLRADIYGNVGAAEAGKR